jgi:HEAT repeat protein
MVESPVGVDALVTALSSDSDADVRKQAAWALGMIEDPRAAGALSDALEDPDADVREQAMWAIGMVVSSSDGGGIEPSELARKLRRALRE